MSPEHKQAIEEVESWPKTKSAQVMKRLFTAAKHGVKTSTPNLLSVAEAEECDLMLKVFEFQLTELEEEINSTPVFEVEDEEDSDYESNDSRLPASNVDSGDSEPNITSEDKGALAEFAQKLADKAESMPVTSVIDPGTQEETAVLKSEDSTQQASGTPTPSEDTGKKSSEKTSKKAGKK